MMETVSSGRRREKREGEVSKILDVRTRAAVVAITQMKAVVAFTALTQHILRASGGEL